MGSASAGSCTRRAAVSVCSFARSAPEQLRSDLFCYLVNSEFHLTHLKCFSRFFLLLLEFTGFWPQLEVIFG